MSREPTLPSAMVILPEARATVAVFGLPDLVARHRLQILDEQASFCAPPYRDLAVDAGLRSA
jgi:hypothetical protein